MDGFARVTRWALGVVVGLGACGVDDPGVFSEEIAGPAPDYVLAFESELPPGLVNGVGFAVSTRVENVGEVAAVAESTTRFFLSLDEVIGADVALVARVTVPALGVGAADVQTVEIAVPGGVASGTYWLLACADRGRTVAEGNERNNCDASGPAAVSGPDLVVDAVAGPPATLEPGQSFSIEETVRNAGTAAAGESVVGYFLSPEPARGGRRVAARREVGPLAPGETSAGTVTGRAPELSPGQYFLVACADVAAAVEESAERNNCTASASTVTVGLADLVVSAVSDPPPRVAAGETFFALDTTSNAGIRAAPASATRFFLSADEAAGSDDVAIGARAVARVAAGGASSAWTALTVDASAPPGDYFLLACADADGVVEESSETNNCLAAGARLTVPGPEETSCGDGVLDDGEQCDDGNRIDDDRCDSDCVPSAVAQVVGGARHTCVRTRSGGVRCWGAAGSGQLGYGNTTTIGDNEDPASAGSVDVGGPVAELAAGSQHTCARLVNGAVKCWGLGQFGVLGYGNTSNIGDDETPASAGNVPLGAPALRITVGPFHTCAVLVGGGVRCWGRAARGRLGYGNQRNIGDDETPASAGDVDVGGTAVEIAGGGEHTCARLASGAVRCWGRGSEGQLGYGNTEHVGDDERPASVGDVDLGGAAVELVTGGLHTCARLEDGALRCWGDPWFGVLGYGNGTRIGDDETPASAGNVMIGGGVAEIAAGANHMCARLATGGIRCWGRAVFGALGYGNLRDIGDDETPASAGDVNLGGGRAVELGTGFSHTCVVLGAGMRCWGDSTSGTLGVPGISGNIGDDETPLAIRRIRVF